MFPEAWGQAKVIGIHAPPIGPYPGWLDPDMLLGRSWPRLVLAADGTIARVEFRSALDRPAAESFAEQFAET